MKSNSILISEKKKVLKYCPQKDVYQWEVDIEFKVTGISRIDDYVFVTSSSNWGVQMTSLIDFSNGQILWTINDIFYSVHIIDDLLIYTCKSKYYTGINIKTGVKQFSTKSPFKWWVSPKSMLLNGSFYLYSSKKVFLLNRTNGTVSESKLPHKLKLKEMNFVLDEFQININHIPSAGGDAQYYGDVGGDAGGGDAGGGGEA
ncbi:MAG: hypothetical protein ACPHSE_01815 [Flavobacteriaceae bacterium]